MHVPRNVHTDTDSAAQRALYPSRLAYYISIRGSNARRDISALLETSNGNMLLPKIRKEDSSLVLAREGLDIVLKDKQLKEYDRIKVAKHKMSINPTRNEPRVKTPLRTIAAVIFSQQGLTDLSVRQNRGTISTVCFERINRGDRRSMNK